MDELSEVFRRALAGRYAIDREVTRPGGMASVFVARDLKHDRRVAIKVLPEQLSAGVARERFELETRLAAQLSHPHIVPMYDSGEADGLLYYVMPYIEGESLRDRLDREQQLPLEDTTTIIRQVASALEYAHTRGVIHRDIKPENILLHEGEALVADFGVARPLGVGDSGRLTGQGISIGTPAYMSPEQSAGDREIDGRSDVYSLGCVAYELLVGAPPFTGHNAQYIISRKLTETAPRIRGVRATVPESMEQAILRALSRSPADRFTSPMRFADALAGSHVARPGQPIVLAAATAIALLAALGYWASRGPAARGLAPSIAVVPCNSIIHDSTRRYLGDVMTDEIISELSTSRLFRTVVALPSVATYRGTTKRPTQIGAELGVASLLYCDFEVTPGRERLKAQLIDATNGALMWVNTFDQLAGSADALPARITAGLSRAFGAATTAGQRSSRKSPRNPEALRDYREAQHFLANAGDEKSLRQSITSFRQSLTHDSSFALPYVGLGTAYMLLGVAHGAIDEQDAFALTREMASRALSLDSNVAEAHALLGQWELVSGWHWDEAERALRRAVLLDTNSATAHLLLGSYYQYTGRQREMATMMQRAVELDPVNAITLGTAGWAYYTFRDFARARSGLEHTLELIPNNGPALWGLGAIDAETGELTRAIAELRRADSTSGHQALSRGWLGYAYALNHDTAAARTIVRGLRRDWTETITPGKTAAALALVQIGAGHRDSAFAWLDSAYARRSNAHIWVLINPPGHRLASDPRYNAMLKRVGLERRRRSLR